MNHRVAAGCLIIVLFLFLTGCNTAFMVGDKVVGIHSGKFFYTDGTLRTDYNVSFEHAWTACEKTLQDMKATVLEVEKKISKGKFDATMEGEDVSISVEYVESTVTRIAVRVGLAGNNVASRLIHDKIRMHLSENRT